MLAQDEESRTAVESTVSSIQGAFFTSLQAMNEYMKEDQKIIKECARESMEYQIEQMKEYEADAIKTAEKTGCKISYLSEEQVKEFQEAAEPVNEGGRADYMDIMNEIKTKK